MICPHCNRNLKQKERTGRTCSHCRKRFALDPKENTLLLHDLRLRKLAAKLSEDGKYRFTAAQLHHAAARKPVKASARLTPRIFWALVIAAIFTAVVAGEVPRLVLVVLAVLAATLTVSLAVLTYVRAKRRPRGLPMGPGEFGSSVLSRYRNIWGNPPGLIDTVSPKQVELHGRAGAVVADQLTLECLRANNLADAMNLALVPVEMWHNGASKALAENTRLSVLLLHDASPPAIQLAGRMLAELGPGRVVDVGLRPRMVMAKKGPLVLRSPPEQQTLDEIRSSGQLTEAELAWLAEGNWVPLAAIRPAALIKAVTRSAERVTALVDPEQRKAKAVSFLSWPEG
jgi:hypothetical protein